MANQILAGAVVSAGAVIAGVDADNPPYVGPPAYWAETVHGMWVPSGSSGNESTTADLEFEIGSSDSNGTSILYDIASNLTNNQIFKVEFRNSNKVVYSMVSPEQITMFLDHPVPKFRAPFLLSDNTWRVPVRSQGSLVGNQHTPAVELRDSGVMYNETTVPPPPGEPGRLVSFDQIIFYNQSGGAVVAMDLSYTRTGNGFDADGSASSATSLTSVTDPLSMPTTWTQAAGTSQDWNLEVVSGQAFSLTIDTGSGASTGVNLFDENGNYVYGWSQDWTLNIGWTPSSSGTYRIRFNSNPHHGDTTFTVTSTSGLA